VCRCVDDTQVGLVRYQVADIVGGQVVTLHDLDRCIGHVRYGGFENGLSFLIDIVPAFVYRIVCRGIGGAAGFHVQVLRAGCVRMQDRVEDTCTVSRRFEQYGCGAVTEDRAGRAVGVVDD